MTRVALYARYSSENQKESSIEDQFRNCEKRAAREGWTVTARYEDRAISGATAERPGYQQMLKDAKTKQFDILLVDDFSRLSRDSIETEQARRRLVHWRVRLIGVSDGIDTEAKGHKMLSGFKGMMNEVFLDDLRDKTRRGMVGQALKGYHCGGRAYGYRLVPEYDPSKKDPYGHPARVGTRLEKHPDQAHWVQWIFEQYAEGQSPLKIVEELNRQGVPPPGTFYRRRSLRTPTWCASALHGDLNQGTGLLNNPLYSGQRIWNRAGYRKDPDTKRSMRVLRDRSEWVITPAPQLRIIDDALWERVRARQRDVHEQSATIRAVLHVNARTGRGPKYLFSGLLVCGQCQGKFVIVDPLHYGYSGWKYRGLSVCDNTIKVSRQLVESRLLQAVKDDLFTQEGLAVFKQEVARLLAEQRRTQTPDLAKAKARLQVVEQEIEHIMTAIKAGVLTASTKTALEQAEAERARLLQAMQGPHKKLDKVASFLPNMVGKFKALVDDLVGATQHEVNKARGILKELVGGQIALHPAADGADRYLTAELSGNYAGLMRLAAGKNKFGGGQGS